MTKLYRYFAIFILFLAVASLYQNCGDTKLKKSAGNSTLTTPAPTPTPPPPVTSYPDNEFQDGTPSLGCKEAGWKWFSDGSFNIPGLVGIDFYPSTLWVDDTYGLFLFGRSSKSDNSAYYQNLIRSQDQGLTWQALNGPPTTGPTTYWPQISATQDGALYIAYNVDMYSTRLKKSTDGGTTWTTTNSPSTSGARTYIESVPNSQLLWIRDEGGSVSVDTTSNGGTTWQSHVAMSNLASALEKPGPPKLILDGSRATLNSFQERAGVPISNYKVRSVYGTSPGTILVDTQTTDQTYLDFTQGPNGDFYLVGYNNRNNGIATAFIERWHNGHAEVVYRPAVITQGSFMQSIVFDKDGTLWASQANYINGKIEVLKSEDGSTWSVFASTSNASAYHYRTSLLRLDSYGYPILSTGYDTALLHTKRFAFGRYCP